MSDTSFLTVEKICDLLDVKADWVYTRIESLEIPNYKVGNLVRVDRDDFDAWLKSKRRG